jgi:hypothetical protein
VRPGVRTSPTKSMPNLLDRDYTHRRANRRLVSETLPRYGVSEPGIAYTSYMLEVPE